MRPFAYERPTRLADAVALLAEHGPDARLLAGGTDLIIRLRDGSIAPRFVVDVKRIGELDDTISEVDGALRIGARTVMTDIAADERVRRDYPALAEAASVVGIRPDPQPRDAGGQHLQRVPGGRHRARAPRLRRTRRRGRSGRARGRSRSTTSSSGPASRRSSAVSSCWRSSCRGRRARAARSTSAGPAVAATTSHR